MQTFLPYPDFARSAQALDRPRLGKQRIEALEILCIITGEAPVTLTKTGHNIARYALPGGWRYDRHESHPACRMWQGYPDALRAYYMAVVREWEIRGYRHNIGYLRVPPRYKLPPWFGRHAIHLSHQANLIRKDPDHYLPIFGNVPPQDGYEWPI